MKARIISAALVAFLASLDAASAQRPQLLPPAFLTVQNQDAKDKAKQPEKIKVKPPVVEEKKPLAEPSPFDFFAQTTSNFGDVRSGFNPHMLGDQFGRFARRSFPVFGTLTVSTFNPNPPSGPVITTGPFTFPVTTTRSVLVPVPNAGAFKVAENASPRPQDRVFAAYNYYSDIRSPYNPTQPTTVTATLPPTTDAFGTTTFASVQFQAPGIPYAQLHRETFGFEKTFFDGRASIEVRLPLLQQQSSLGEFQTERVGDLTVNTKYAFVLDPFTNNVLSGGVAITAPTGGGILTDAGTIRSTLIQPWVGYIYNFDRFYIQGFHSFVLPTDDRDVNIAFNDIGLNWWLFYRPEPIGIVNYIVPTIETHITTALNHRNDSGPIVVYDHVVMTAGVHFGLFRASTLTLGVATPVTGPRVYDMEAFVQYNRRF